MLFGQKLLLLVYGIQLVMVVAGERPHFPFAPLTPLKVSLVNENEAVNENSFTLQPITTVLEDGKLNLLLYKSQESREAQLSQKTVCICVHTNDPALHNTKTKYCSEYSRICFEGFGSCYGKDEHIQSYCHHSTEEIDGKTYYIFNITVKRDTATITEANQPSVVLAIAPFSPQGGNATNPVLSVGLVAFYPKGSDDCTDEHNPDCKHLDVLYYNRTVLPVIPPPVIKTTEKPAETKPSTLAAVPPLPLIHTTTEGAADASFPILYVCLGILGAIIIIIIIICVLRCVQGIWCCGLLCFKRKEESEDVIIEKKCEFPDSKEAINKEDGPKEIQIIEGKKAEEIVQGNNEMKVVFEYRQFLQNGQPAPAPTPGTQEQKNKPVVSRETKDTTGNEKTDEKDSGGETDGATSGATTNQVTTTTPAAAATAEKKKVRAPNMLLLATKEDDTQSEGQIPSKRKTKVEKNNKEPAATKNVTQDPGAPATKGIATGKAATTMKTGLKRTEAQTGIPKSETDLATDKGGPAATKGVSATQGDKVTENFETRPTQQTATMATGAAKPTTLGTTQFGTQTTQGGATTAGGKTQTGIARTRATGPTQLPSSDTNETQIPTGATKTKPTQFATGATKTKATQFATGATQKFSTGTTQAATGTTQRGTTMATGLTQGGTAATQARTGGTRQTGETQNPDEADINIDPTQFAGTTVGGGGSRPTVAGTQMPSDASADPTQNPTAFTGGEGGGIKTSKTQFGTTAGTKTRTRDTQKQTKQTDAL